MPDRRDSTHDLSEFRQYLGYAELNNRMRIIAGYLRENLRVCFVTDAEIQRLTQLVRDGKREKAIEPGPSAIEEAFFEDKHEPGDSYRKITPDIFLRRTTVGHVTDALAIVAPETLRASIEAEEAKLRHSHSGTAASLSHRTAARYGINRARWIREYNRI
ncbi:hypothetical protein JCM10212_001413 [Sporobolomyces blumeae]